MLTDAQRAYMAMESALRAGDLDAVRAAFAGNSDFPNVRDPLTWTHLLSLAISWSPRFVVQQLLDLGADPNFEAPDGFPAVYSALSMDRPDKMELLPAILHDWTLAGIVTLQSGMPVAVTQSTNFNAFAGFGTQRPNLVGDPELPAGERRVNRWFDTGAFTSAPQFTIGNSSRNPVRGPSYRNLDLALIRRVPVRSGTALEIRAEVFNATNTPPFGPPNGVFGTPGFGSITSAGDPRVIQLAVKFLY